MPTDSTLSCRAVENAAGRAHRALLMWIFGGRGQWLPTYRQLYDDRRPSPRPDLAPGWQGRAAEKLLGEACQQHAAPQGLDGLAHAAN